MTAKTITTSSTRSLPLAVTVSQCIGCGAIRAGEPCADGGCRDHRLDLVRAAEHDEVLAATRSARERAAALRPVAERLVAAQPGPDGHADALGELRGTAREALAAAHAHAHAEPAETVTTWWCPRCERVEAPQPCIGVCIFHPHDMVRADEHEAAVADLERAEREQHAATTLATLAATLRPRAGHAERTWHALRDRAEHLLAGAA